MKAKIYYPVFVLAVVAGLFASCTKNAVNKPVNATSNASNTISTTSSSTIAATGSIGIGGTALDATSSTGRDSIYAMNCFPPKGYRDSVAFSALPSAIGTYLTANYSGYTFVKAFAISDSTKTLINYVVVINFNSNPVALKFTATGTFVSVLQQRAGQDLAVPAGCHPGGPFNDRGNGPDTIALSAIPSAVKTAFTTAYPTDTLVHAGIAPDGSYVLISKNKTLYATDITTTGTVVSHLQIPGAPATHTAVTQANLPTAISTYLTTTYPGYVFDKAFSASNSSGIIGYEVFITANNTNYAVTFDASGNFVKAVVVR